MAKLGAEYSDDLTPTSDSGTSLSEHSNTTGDSDSQYYNSSSDDNDSNPIQHFPIMDLPVEIRAKIFNMIPQRDVTHLRRICKQWLEEVEQFYEFSFSIYDTSNNLFLIKRLRCRECIIWKLSKDLSEPLFDHPAYIKIIKVFGPTSPANLKALISSAVGLEHLTLTRRANYPWILNLQDTPALSNLTELKFLRLNSEEHLQIRRPSSTENLKVPPMMDCYFPKLKVFEILKRFPVWHYSHHVTSVLKFVSRHSATLDQIELDFIPLSCISMFGDQLNDDMNSSDDEEYNLENNLIAPHGPNFRRNREDKCVSAVEINLHQLCKIRLKKLCITTMGYSKDIHIWKSLLESQAVPFQMETGRQHEPDHFETKQETRSLRELRFDWLCRDRMTEVKARVSGFPWIHFQVPIEACSSTLVHVELANLSMVLKSFTSSPVTSSCNCSSGLQGTPSPVPGGPIYKVSPFDLSIFRHCNRLKSIILRCRENHARIYPVDLGHYAQYRATNQNGAMGEGADAVNGNGQGGAGGGENRDVVSSVGEILLMVNAMELPESLEQLEIFRFPTLMTDIAACVKKLTNLRKLFLHECGKTCNFGVTAEIIELVAKLRNLKFLEIVGFNDATEERKKMLELVFQKIGRPFEGQDTWLELCDGSTTAFDTLQSVVE